MLLDEFSIQESFYNVDISVRRVIITNNSSHMVCENIRTRIERLLSGAIDV